jgi:uncharacterized protein (TIGR03435 family)
MARPDSAGYPPVWPFDPEWPETLVVCFSRVGLIRSSGGGHGPGPNVPAAVQEQLGLKLDSARGPAEVMVIDHVEKPGAN